MLSKPCSTRENFLSKKPQQEEERAEEEAKKIIRSWFNTSRKTSYLVGGRPASPSIAFYLHAQEGGGHGVGRKS